MDTVLLTIDIGRKDNDFPLDIEVSSNVPVDQIKKALFAAFKANYYKIFQNWAGCALYYGGQAISGTATLNDYNIWDGSVITVKEAGRMTG